MNPGAVAVIVTEPESLRAWTKKGTLVPPVPGRLRRLASGPSGCKLNWILAESLLVMVTPSGARMALIAQFCWESFAIEVLDWEQSRVRGEGLTV